MRDNNVDEDGDENLPELVRRQASEVMHKAV